MFGVDDVVTLCSIAQWTHVFDLHELLFPFFLIIVAFIVPSCHSCPKMRIITTQQQQTFIWPIYYLFGWQFHGNSLSSNDIFSHAPTAHYRPIMAIQMNSSDEMGSGKNEAYKKANYSQKNGKKHVKFTHRTVNASFGHLTRAKFFFLGVGKLPNFFL